MKVFWTQTALGHLAAIHQGLALDSPAFARRTVDRITTRSGQIEASPNPGQPISAHEDPDIRAVKEGPYCVLYKPTPNGVHVLAVLHAMTELA